MPSDGQRSGWADRRSLLAVLGSLAAGCSSLDSTGDGGEDTESGSPSGDSITQGRTPESIVRSDRTADTTPTYETVEPPSTDEQFCNPHRGWVLTGWPSEFEGEDVLLSYGQVGYFRFPWSQVQPGPGEFDWAPLEVFLEGFDELGLRGAFGVMTANAHSPADRPFVTPEWVFDDGAEYKTVEFERDDPVLMDSGTPGTKVVPKFDDPVFLDHLETFLEALAGRYDGDDRIEFLDVRSYGNWGEGHMWPFYHRFENMYEPLDPVEYRQHVDLHTAAFDETQLLINAKGAANPLRDVQESLVDDGVGMRTDGIVGSSDGSETAYALGNAPVTFEWFAPYAY